MLPIYFGLWLLESSIIRLVDEGSIILFSNTTKSLAISASRRGHGLECWIQDEVLDVISIFLKVWILSELDVLKVALHRSICINSNSSGVVTYEATAITTPKETSNHRRRRCCIWTILLFVVEGDFALSPCCWGTSFWIGCLSCVIVKHTMLGIAFSGIELDLRVLPHRMQWHWLFFCRLQFSSPPFHF